MIKLHKDESVKKDTTSWRLLGNGMFLGFKVYKRTDGSDRIE